MHNPGDLQQVVIYVINQEYLIVSNIWKLDTHMFPFVYFLVMVTDHIGKGNQQA